MLKWASVGGIIFGLIVVLADIVANDVIYAGLLFVGFTAMLNGTLVFWVWGKLGLWVWRSLRRTRTVG